MEGRIRSFFLSLLLIRFLQAARFLKELGIIRAVILISCCFYLVMPAGKVYFTDTVAGGAFAALTLLLIHISRKDRRFLTTVFGRRGYRAMAIEYALISLPCCCYYLYSGNIASLAVLLPAIFGVPFIQFRLKRAGGAGAMAGLFPARAFELRSCFRENWFLFLLILPAGLIFSRQPAIPALAMLSITLIFTFSTSMNEPRVMLETFRSGSELLRYKVSTYLNVLLVCLSPLLLAFLLFHYQYWYLLAALLLACCMILLLGICLKYAFYVPETDMLANKILVGSSVACFVIVYLAPLPFIMLPFYYRKARKNLDNYFYAED
ncbi:hypothetical protein EDD80_10778 [Anseongella ginsenosidimutans]|uniref:Uncharacterized protein n=1 Tax=Anseongella ginsenosidimutans TaxID=496056 RepID=A0A4R3KS76_9SPHI|nr:hypothetical protein [Anseongella ginsenosidimutans]QEC52622.1 hypothetical protein FRZ59_09920 [Anseongella ginsenosidimutans]TCS86545.1 hypothetical protein EDD80_10778 [Anseongella ginsenosidimutans]